MKRVTVSLPDDVAAELTGLAETLGVSRSAFLSGYLAGRLRRLRSVAEEYVALDPARLPSARRYRGNGADDILRLAELIADAAEAAEADDRG